MKIRTLSYQRCLLFRQDEFELFGEEVALHHIPLFLFDKELEVLCYYKILDEEFDKVYIVKNPRGEGHYVIPSYFVSSVS